MEEEASERTPLLGRSTSPAVVPPRPETRRTGLFCLLLFLLGVVGLGAALLSCYLQFYHAAVRLRVLSLNVWGMPAKVGSQDKELRMRAIGEFIGRAEHDVYLLAELWLRPDHATIAARIPPGYTMTRYGDFALSTCDGRVLPTFCSGLAIVSRYPIIERQFHEFSDHGDILKPDGEYWARKGAGRARLALRPGLSVDVFVTHTIAVGPNYTNAWYRQRQVRQLVGWVDRSNADFAILGGDFNTDPKDNETSYHDLKRSLVSSMEEFWRDIREWLVPSKATYGNPGNTYSSQYQPVLYDYIWHRASGRNMIWTNLFQVPLLTTPKFFTTAVNATHDASRAVRVSFSDHEAVTSDLYLWKSIF